MFGNQESNWDSPPPEGPVSSLKAGVSTMCALDDDNEPICWGKSINFLPLLDLQPAKLMSIDVAGGYACGITISGKITCWGRNDFGGNEPPEGEFEVLDIEDTYGVAISVDGTLTEWGNMTGDYAVDQPPETPKGTFVEVAAGNHHACAIRTNRNIVCWTSVPGDSESLDAPEGKARDIDAAGDGTCAILESGEAECWGGYWEPSD
jgi:alpha-tubulin suppressor-like RCC1 family protein